MTIRNNTSPYLMIPVVALLLAIASCGPSVNIEVVSIDTTNAMRVKVHVTTKDKTSLAIVLNEQNNISQRVTDFSMNNTDHEFTLYHLNTGTSYEFDFLYINHDTVLADYPGSFNTIDVPEYLPEIEIIENKGNVFQGYIMIRNVQAPGQQIILDNTGKIVWYQDYDSTLFRPFSWVNNQSVLSLLDEREIEEIDLAGNVRFNLKYGDKGFDRLLHHEIIKDNKGNIISLTRNNQVFNLTELGGSKSDTVKGDGVIVLDSEGNKLWEWDIFDFVDPRLDKNIMETKDDWSHANSIELDSDGNYLVSFRHFNQVWKINSTSGEVIWKLGENGDLKLETDQQFYLQHAAHINSFGEIMLFDNGGPDRMLSRAVSYRLNADDKSVAIGSVDILLPKNLFSFKQGSAYLINDDKVLICSSIKNTVLITDLKAEILWQIKLSESVYRAVYINEIDWGLQPFIK